MSTIEQEILDRIRKLAPENQQRVLKFLDSLDMNRPLSVRELMKLPPEERQQHVQAAIDSSINEDFETFEAYSEEHQLDE